MGVTHRKPSHYHSRTTNWALDKQAFAISPTSLPTELGCLEKPQFLAVWEAMHVTFLYLIISATVWRSPVHCPHAAQNPLDLCPLSTSLSSMNLRVLFFSKK